MWTSPDDAAPTGRAGPARIAPILLVAAAALLRPPAAARQICPTPAQLAADLAAASQDDVISLSGVNPLDCPEVAMTSAWTGGRLIFSDSPEKPATRGKLYEDTTLGATPSGSHNRVFLYHVNGKTDGTRMKFTALLRNAGSGAGTLTIQKRGTAGPTTSYLYAGKIAFKRWLDSTAAAGIGVPAGATVEIDATFGGTTAARDYLLHGIWDYSFDQPHAITICALDEGDNATAVCPGLPVLPRDTHRRGTFPYADKAYDTASGQTVETAAGIAQLPIAGGTADDPYAVGTDMTDGSTQTLAGNYGVLYRMHLAAASSDGRNLGFLLNPRGGAWGGAVWARPGLTPGGKFLIPETTTWVAENTKGAVEGKYAPGGGTTLWLQLMPTGGASLPLRLVAVPY
ncbi:MAG TPA: hypothetical protein VNK92_03905 [Vicinamibacterales bacterium]|nr:hypothetical protein [Vicinamibacterales bacterium]